MTDSGDSHRVNVDTEMCMSIRDPDCQKVGRGLIRNVQINIVLHLGFILGLKNGLSAYIHHCLSLVLV